MSYKAYFYRYGVIQCEKFDNKEEAIDFIEDGVNNGELFGDCVVGPGDIIVHDFDAQAKVIGRNIPESRVGKVYSHHQ